MLTFQHQVKKQFIRSLCNDKKHVIFSSFSLVLMKRQGLLAVPSWCVVFPQAEYQVSSLHSSQQLAGLQASSLGRSAALCVLHSCRNPPSLPADCIRGLLLPAAQHQSPGSSSLDAVAAVFCNCAECWSRLRLWCVHNRTGLGTASLDTLRVKESIFKIKWE